MKANQLVVRPASRICSSEGDFSIYWVYEINCAKEIYTGSEEQCYARKNELTSLLNRIRDIIFKEFTEEKFNLLNSADDEILNIYIGALNFEFTKRDFNDGLGDEINCECFILGKDTGYGYTSLPYEKPGIPYDDEWCLNWYTEEVYEFSKARELVYKEISDFTIASPEFSILADESKTSLTWKTIINKVK